MSANENLTDFSFRLHQRKMKTRTMNNPITMRIHTIKSLNRKIHELKQLQQELENNMDSRLDELKGNYVNMTLNSIFGGKGRGNF